jgi:DNA (cytosine-5)-methyltransferase 1
MNKYNFIEICAGCGGMSNGLIKAGIKPVLLIDNNKNCCETLKLNHKNVKIKCANFEDIDISEYINKIDVLAGGVPCQAFSYAGKRNGLKDERGLLILKFISLIDKIKPKIFVIENVKGLLTLEKGRIFNEIIDKIREIKYNVQYKILNSFDYEVPQKRERIFIVGTINKEKFDFPEKIKEKKILRDVLYDVPKSDGSSYSEIKKKLFEMIPQGGCWINLTKELQKQYLGKSYYSGGGKRGILHRLSMEKPSLTLLCSPTQKQTERCHPIETRPLTIREYARIQTFSDDYVFVGSLSSKYKQIGNAVPIKLAYHLAKAIINYLDKLK